MFAHVSIPPPSQVCSCCQVSILSASSCVEKLQTTHHFLALAVRQQFRDVHLDRDSRTLGLDDQYSGAYLISYLVYTLLIAPQPQASGIVNTHEYNQWCLPQWRGVDVGTDIYYYWFVSSAIICHPNTLPATPTGRMSLESGVQRQKLA